MKNIKSLSILFIITILILFLLLAWNNFTSSPYYSLYQINKALKNSDYDTFIEYVDVASVTENIIDEIVREKKLDDSFLERVTLRLVRIEVENIITDELKVRIERGDYKNALNQKGLYQSYKSINLEKSDETIKVYFKDNDKISSASMRKKDKKWIITEIEFKNINNLINIRQEILNLIIEKIKSRYMD